MNTEHRNLLKKVYYTDKVSFGRDRLYQYIRANYPESKITRREIAEWLSQQEIQQLFTKAKHRTNTRPIIPKGIKDIAQADIIDFSKNPYKNFNYILNIIDVFSRKVWMYALKNKTAENVKKCFLDLQKEEKITFNVIRTDSGKEFSFDFKEIGSKHIIGDAFTPQHQSISERVTSTIKMLIKKQLYISQNNDWVSILKKIEDAYNNTIHTALKNYTPNEIYNGNEEKREEISAYINSKKSKSQSEVLKQLDIGDRVRVLLLKPKNSKLHPTYSREIFTITKVIPVKSESNSIERYQIKDKNNDIVKGYFNITRLLKIKKIEKAPGQKNIKTGKKTK